MRLELCCRISYQMHHGHTRQLIKHLWVCHHINWYMVKPITCQLN